MSKPSTPPLPARLESVFSDLLKELSSGGHQASTLMERARLPRWCRKPLFFFLGYIAKADGRVTRDEVAAFREVFQIASSDEAGAARVFNMARTDVAGYQEYARRIQRMFADDPKTLCDLMEGLFHIAMADGFYHPGENSFLEDVAEILGVPAAEFMVLRARFVPDAVPDPYSVLGVSPDMPITDIRKAWRKLVKETHPDKMLARGVPEEAIQLAEKRMIDINRAWEDINRAAA